jgi:hypothetical protein
MPVMLKIYVCQVAAGAVVSAALTAGSLGLTATAASACAGSAACGGGPPPATASVMECTDPRCVSGTQPAAAGAATATTVVRAADGCTTSDCGANHNQVLA